MQIHVSLVILFALQSNAWQLVNLNATKSKNVANRWIVIQDSGLEGTVDTEETTGRRSMTITTHENATDHVSSSRTVTPRGVNRIVWDPAEAIGKQNMTTDQHGTPRHRDSLYHEVLLTSINESWNAAVAGSSNTSLLHNTSRLVSGGTSGKRTLIVVASLLGFVLLFFIVVKIIGLCSKAYLQSNSFRSMLGVDLHIGRLSILPFSCGAIIHELVLDNPKGYLTEYLCKIKKLRITVAPWTFVCSGFTTLHIMKLSIEEIEVNMECSGNINVDDSNVHDIVNQIYYGKMDACQEDEELAASGREYVLHEVSVKGIHSAVSWRPKFLMCRPCTVCRPSTYIVQANVEVADIMYKDLMSEMLPTTAMVGNVLKFLLSTVLHKVLESSLALRETNAARLCSAATRLCRRQIGNSKQPDKASLPKPAEENEESFSGWFPEAVRPYVDDVADVSIKIVQIPVNTASDMEIEI